MENKSYRVSIKFDPEPKSLFIICVLSQFTKLLFFNLNYPMDIIIFITSYYDFVNTHVDVKGINRDLLFEKLWRMSRQTCLPFISDLWDLTNAKQMLYTSPYYPYEEETYAETIADVPIYVDIYQKGNMMNCSKYNAIVGENMFQKIVNLIQKMYKKFDNLEELITLSDGNDVSYIGIGDRVYINYRSCYYPRDLNRGCNTTLISQIDAEGCIVKISNRSLDAIIKITESYSFDYEEGKQYEIRINKISIIW